MDTNMNKRESYRYKTEDSFVDVTTLSPLGKFYYKIKPFIALNKSAFGCRISFFQKDTNELIYYRSEAYAHELHDKEEIEISHHEMQIGQTKKNEKDGSIMVVKWSKDGNMAYFLEYCETNNGNTYESVFLNLSERYCYRIDEVSNNFKIVNELNLQDREFKDAEVLKRLSDLGLFKQQLTAEGLPKRSLLDTILNRHSWYPSSV
jgi:hypothetical protein